MGGSPTSKPLGLHNIFGYDTFRISINLRFVYRALLTGLGHRAPEKLEVGVGRMSVCRLSNAVAYGVDVHRWEPFGETYAWVVSSELAGVRRTDKIIELLMEVN